VAVRVELSHGFPIEEDFENIKIGIEMTPTLDGYDAPFLYAKVPSEGIKVTAGRIKYGEASKLSDISEKLYLELNTKLVEKSLKTTKGSSQLVLKEEVKGIVQRLIERYLSSCRISEIQGNL